MLAETHTGLRWCTISNHLQDLHPLIPQSMVSQPPNCHGAHLELSENIKCLPPTLPQTLIYLIHRASALQQACTSDGHQAEMLQEETELERAKLGLHYLWLRHGRGHVLS